jgi:lysophospholipase L1-like esterase
MAADTSMRFAVLGDSIAYGQGATRATETPGARLAARLAEAGTPTELRVFAVPGARSDGLAAQVRRAVDWGAELVLIIIGANDLTRLVPPDRAAAQLGDAIGRLRAAAAQVVVAPAPDLSAVPWVPPQLRAVVKSGSDLLRAAQTRAAIEAGATVADVGGSTSAAFADDLSLFSADRFHPSSAGYARIADALGPAVLAAASERGR